MTDAERIKELEEANARLIAECSHMESRMAAVHMLEDKIAKFEERIDRLIKSETRAWDLWREARHERDVTRDAASEAIRQLQVELERFKHVSRETSEGPNGAGGPNDGQK